MKRYLLFAGEYYYPSGGWRDFWGAFDSVDDARKELDAQIGSYDWYHIVDTETMEQI